MKSCLIVFVIITATHAATYFKPPANKTVCCGGTCVVYCDYAKKNLLPGKSYKPPGECSIVTCNNDFSMSYADCGVMMSDVCNRYGPDYSLTYPKCCNKICLDPKKP